MEYLQQVMNSKYFEHIKDHNHFEKKIQRLIEASRIVQKKPLDVICEYGSKSNFLYFVLEGRLAVFIPKNESDLNKQYSLLMGIEKCKKAINKDPSQVEAHDKLQKLQTEWQKQQKLFDSELLNSLKKYQISLKPSQQGWDDEFYLEQRKSTSYQTSSLMRKDVCSMKKVGEMTGGDCFGEIGAILDKPRTATIISVENSTCMLVSYKKYQEIFSSEQIYELNFRVLNLSQIFSEKSVETEVVAHLATHFYQIPASSMVYREGDKVDGLYLIHNGHVEIFRTQKEYFNNQISIVIKGKGSLIGLEDYFEFDKNSLILNKEKVKINNKKNGRTYSAICKDLNMKIYKIDKGILDYFVEGYSHFKNYLLTLAHQKFIEYSSKYKNNLELKKKLSSLTLQQTPSKKQTKKQSADIFDGQNTIPQPINLSPIQTNRQKQTSLDRLEEIQSDKLENKPVANNIKSQIEEQYNQDSSHKKNQSSVNFPEMLRYENSKIKDLKQNYEVYLKRSKRPQKQQNFSYAKYEAFLKNKFDQEFINHLEQQRKIFYNQSNQKQSNKQSDQQDLDLDPELIKNKDNIDFIAQQNQIKSLKYIQQHQVKSKTEKTAPNVTEYSRDDLNDQDENEMDSDDLIGNKQHTEKTKEQNSRLSQSQYNKLFKFKSMNFISGPHDTHLVKENSCQNITRNDSAYQINYNLNQRSKLSDEILQYESSNTKTEIESIQQESLTKFDTIKRLTTQLTNQDSMPFISNQEFMDQLKNKSSNILLQSELNINEGSYQESSIPQLLQEEQQKNQNKQAAINNNIQEEAYKKESKGGKIPNFLVDQDRSGKKIILRINRNKSELLFSPQARSQNTSLHHMSNGDQMHSHNDNNTSLHTLQYSERKENKQGYTDTMSNNSQQSTIPLMKQTSPRMRYQKGQQLLETNQYLGSSNFRDSTIESKKCMPINLANTSLKNDSFQSENTPQAKNTPNSGNNFLSNSLFLPKINNPSNVASQEPNRGKISQFNTNITSPARAQPIRINQSIPSLKNVETLPVKSPKNNMPYNPFRKEENESTPVSKNLLDMKSPAKFSYRQSAPHLDYKQENNLTKVLTPFKQNQHLIMKNAHIQSTTSVNQNHNQELEQGQPNQIQFYYSQSTSKRDSIQAQKQKLSFLKNTRHSSSMIGLESDNNNSIQFQNQSMISHNFYNSHIQSNSDDQQAALGTPAKKLKLRKMLINSSNSVFNMHTHNLNYSKPTEHLKMLHKKEQIMDDIQTKISLFPQRKKNGSFHKDQLLKKLNSQELKPEQLQGNSPKSPLNQQTFQSIQNNDISSRFSIFNQLENNIQNTHNIQRSSLILESEHFTSNTPSKQTLNKNRQSLTFKSPQNIKSSSIYQLSQAALGSPKKQLNPTQIILLQKQSKSSNNYISNLFTSKLTSGVM